MKTKIKDLNRYLALLFVCISVSFFSHLTFSSKPESGHSGETLTLLQDGRRLIVGGLNLNGPTAIVKMKDTSAGQKIFIEKQMNEPRAWHSATMLPNGSVLILGGISTENRALGSAELFDPDGQTFVPFNFPGMTPRAHHSATLLADGKVVIIGGVSNNGETLRTAEIWNPKTMTLHAVPANLEKGRSAHMASIFPDGTVRLSGGFGEDSKPIKTEEVYHPDTMSFTSAAEIQNEKHDGKELLRVMSSLPADGSTNVPVDTMVSILFSKPFHSNALNQNDFALKGPEGSLSTKIVFAENGMLAFFTPEKPLLPGTSYTLNVFSFSTTFITESTESRFDQFDDEEWTPQPGDSFRNWRTGRQPSSWQSLPPLQAPAGVTALAGQLLKLNGKPLADVTLQVENAKTRSDSTGRFVLYPIDPGKHELLIDGTSANKPGRKYGLFEVGIDIAPRRTNVLSYTIWMPKIDTQNSVRIPSPTPNEIVITTPRIPGLEVRIPSGTIIKDHEGKIVTELSITPIPLDRLPFPFPENIEFPLYFTIQPGGAYTYGSQGLQIIYPNVTHDPSESRFDFWQYDPEDVGWYIYGKGTVTPDEKQVLPDTGVSIYEFTGSSMIKPPDPPTQAPSPGGCNGGSNPEDGDPVDCSSGLFVHRNTDVILRDVLPIVLDRTYRSRDTQSRGFGRGASHSYDLNIWLENNEVQLILPDGARIRYSRITTGSGYGTSEVFEHTTTPTSFLKSQIRWTGAEWRLTLRDGRIYTFVNYYLRSIQDSNGNQLTIDRNFSVIATISSQSGKSLTFTYDSSKRITQVRDNIGRTVNYAYDGGGRVWKVTDPLGRVTEYTYDTSARMLTVKKPNGVLYVTNQYDTNGRVIKQTRTDGSTYQFAYTLNGGGKVIQTNITNPRGFVRKLTFNLDGYILTDTRAFGTPIEQTISYQRETGSNLVLSSTDQIGRKTEFAYDGMKNVTGVTLLAGTAQAVSVSITYEPLFNQIASITDPLNHTVSATRDAKGNPISLRDPLGNTTNLTFNQAGQPTSIRDPLGSTTQFNYDLGDLTAATDSLGNTITQLIDNAGRPVNITAPLGQTTRMDYDLLNRVTRVTDSLQGTTEFTYDSNNNLLSLRDPRGNATTYTYNNMDRVISRTDPLSRTESYQYDPGGNVIRTTDRKGQITNYTYDALDRPTQIIYADGSTTTYTYDALNRLTQVTDSIGGTITMSYDSFDRLNTETTAQGSVSYSYDAVGRRTSMTVNGQASVNYVYDAANRVTQISKGTSNAAFAYDAAGRRTSVSFSNGIVVQYLYNAASQLTEIKYMRGTTVFGNLTYEYDAAGRRTKTAGSFARSSLPNPLTSATYDSSNQQLTFGSQSLNYDANGNLTSDGVNTYSWNARDQLVSVNGPGISSNFQYDSFGRRKTKTVNGTSTSYLYDGLNPVQELSGSTPTANLLTGSGIDEYLMRTDSSGPRFFLRDSLGSTVGLADSTGSLITSYTYEAFGKTITVGAASTNSFQFTGRENDGTGLFHYRARYYHPTFQRFISEDPIAFAGGDVNLYAYVLNDPINLFDPYGLNWLDDHSDEIASYSAGVGDVLLLGFGDELRGYLDVDSQLIDECSGWYEAGEWSGVALSIYLGGLSAGAKGAGKEFSHWIPRRFLKKVPGNTRSIVLKIGKTKVNGNYVKPARHYKHDPFRYPQNWRALGDRYNPLLRQLDRIPGTIDGAIYGLAGEENNNECGCE